MKNCYILPHHTCHTLTVFELGAVYVNKKDSFTFLFLYTNFKYVRLHLSWKDVNMHIFIEAKSVTDFNSIEKLLNYF